MAKEFKLEDPGEGIHEAEIKELHVSEGDEVADGDIILTVETDKAAVEVPAPFAGVIEEIRVAVGDIAEVGEVLMTYREAGAAAGERDKESAGEAEEKPAEKRREEKAEAPEKGAPSKAKRKARAGEGPVPASPATRSLARELGVDLRAVEPSGPAGRVTADDVRAAAEGGEAAPDKPRETEEKRPRRAAPERRPQAPELPDFSQWGEVERVPLRSIRRATAKRMALSWAQIPHVMHQDEADITELEQWRRTHRSAAEEHGGKLTLTVLVMKALVAALKEFPRFNASLDPESEEIVLKRYYHVGVAVDTDQGLVVPVARDVDRKSIVELSAEVVKLADRARAGELAREEMQGGTITVTNPGPLGGRVFTPIIDFPQVAILGLGRARLEPRISGDLDEFEIAPRLILPLCLAFDHRVNDGADAARFTALLADTLANTETILLTA